MTLFGVAALVTGLVAAFVYATGRSCQLDGGGIQCDVVVGVGIALVGMSLVLLAATLVAGRGRGGRRRLD